MKNSGTAFVTDRVGGNLTLFFMPSHQYVIDIESDNLYPYQKSTWTICIKRVGTNLSTTIHPYRIGPEATRKAILDYVYPDHHAEPPTLIGHNLLGFDGWVLWKDFGLHMRVGGRKESFCGRPVKYFDTLFASQFLHPDRAGNWGGHSLEDWGERLGHKKIDYYSVAVQKGYIPEGSPRGTEFTVWSPEMDQYCLNDCQLTEKVFELLNAQVNEENTWDAFKLGQKNFYLMNAQAFTGFKFDLKKAVKLKPRIEGMIEDTRKEAEPELPPRSLKKAEEPYYRMPARPFTKDGSLSSVMRGFVEKHAAKVLPGKKLLVYGKKIDIVPGVFVKDKLPMTLDDQKELKEYFLSVGWKPTMWNFKKDAKGKPMRDGKGKLIQTSPKIQENHVICPNLLELDDDLPKKITKFLSLRNRLGVLTGWMEHPRIEWDGRLPAGSSGLAATHRQKHTTVVNVPKAQDDVLLGKEFRSLFTVEKGMKLVGCDQAALEARCEAHWVYKYSGGQERADQLIAGDLHSINSKVFFPEETLHYDINSPDFNKDDPGFKKYRSLSKNGAYCLPLHTEILTDRGWVKYDDLKIGDTVFSYDQIKNKIVKDEVLQKQFFENKEVFKYANKLNSFECTGDHRWYGWRRQTLGDNSKIKKFGFFEMKDMTTEHNIIISKEFEGGTKEITTDEAALLGWILSEGTVTWSNKPIGNSSSKGKKKGVKCTISQAEHNFANEIEGLLDDLKADYARYYRKGHKNPVVCFDIGSAWIRDFWDRLVGERVGKHDFDWSKWILTIPSEARRSFLLAFWLGDGQVKNWKSKSRLFSQNDGKISDAVQLGFFMEGKKVTVQSKPKSRTTSCRGITASYRNSITCQKLKKESMGVQDTFCITTNNGSFVIRQNKFMMLTGNCLAYGGSPKKLAQTLRKPERDGQRLYDKYWENNPSLKALKDKVEYFWETKSNKKWIPGIDKRRLYSRSKHSLVNLLFQSTGAIIVDLAVCLFDVKMGGLTIDERGRPLYLYKGKVVKRVVYSHDELQFEVDEKIAEEIARIAEWCMEEAGRILRLNIPLEGESKIGNNWSEVH